MSIYASAARAIRRNHLTHLFFFFIFALAPVAYFPWIPDSYVAPKWLFVYLAAAIGIRLVSKNAFVWWPAGTKNSLSVASLIGLVTLSVLLHPGVVTAFVTLDRVIFGALILVFTPLFRDDAEKTWSQIFPSAAVGLSIVLIYGFYQVVSLWLRGAYAENLIVSTFGNSNLLAEYLLFSIPIMIASYRTGGPLVRVLSIVMLFGIFVLLPTTACRSALLGMAFAGLLLFFTAKRKGFILVLVGAPIVVVILLAVGGRPSLLLAKAHSNYDRLNLIRVAREIALENPLGVGPNQYEFSSTPAKASLDIHANEDIIEESPHNEVLKWLAENGWYAFVPIFAVGYQIICAIRKELSGVRTNFNGLLKLLACLVAIPQILFQFPFDTPFGFVWLSLFVGFGLSSSELRPIRVQDRLRFVGATVTATAIAVAAALVTSKWNERHLDTIEGATIACWSLPTNWVSCLSKAQMELNAGLFEDARLTIRAELRKRPFNFVAIRQLAELARSSGDDSKACEAAALYDDLFLRKSALSDFVSDQCAGLRTDHQAPFFQRSQQLSEN